MSDASAGTEDQDALHRDAARWRALMSSERFRLMGWKGFDAVAMPGRDAASLEPNGFDGWQAQVRPDGDGLHFGIEIWDRHPARGEGMDTFVRSMLVAYVDELRKRGTQNESTPART